MMIINSCFETPLTVIFLITHQTYLESLEERTRKASPEHPKRSITLKSIQVYAPINVNPVGGGGGGSAGKGRGFDAWDYPPVGLLIVRSDPGVGTFDFDWQKPGINSEAVTKSVPRGFLKVTLLEKGVKFWFVLIAIIRYFKLSSKQIMSILRKFLSSSSHLIVKLDWNRIPPWKSEDFLRVTDPTCSDMLSRCYKAFYVSLIL